MALIGCGWKCSGPVRFGHAGRRMSFAPAEFTADSFRLNQLAESLQNFQAALVVMSFAPPHRRRMTTSFPSKMIDAMQLGLPVVIWGPEYCSAVKWARRGERALCVTDPNPVSATPGVRRTCCVASRNKSVLQNQLARLLQPISITNASRRNSWMRSSERFTPEHPNV